jgi:hypothetical protein
MLMDVHVVPRMTLPRTKLRRVQAITSDALRWVFLGRATFGVRPLMESTKAIATF